jgi:hypothetical protein
MSATRTLSSGRRSDWTITAGRGFNEGHGLLFLRPAEQKLSLALGFGCEFRTGRIGHPDTQKLHALIRLLASKTLKLG